MTPLHFAIRLLLIAAAVMSVTTLTYTHQAAGRTRRYIQEKREGVWVDKPHNVFPMNVPALARQARIRLDQLQQRIRVLASLAVSAWLALIIHSLTIT